MTRKVKQADYRLPQAIVCLLDLPGHLCCWAVGPFFSSSAEHRGHSKPVWLGRVEFRPCRNLLEKQGYRTNSWVPEGSPHLRGGFSVRWHTGSFKRTPGSFKRTPGSFKNGQGLPRCLRPRHELYFGDISFVHFGCTYSCGEAPPRAILFGALARGRATSFLGLPRLIRLQRILPGSRDEKCQT